MKYNYYNSGENGVVAVNKIYKGINTTDDLYRALSNVWSIETCTERLRNEWSIDNKTCGQCAITALIAQDIFGGVIKEMFLPFGAIHCYNEVNGICFDLTSEQFKSKSAELNYKNNPLQDREMRLKNPTKAKRYELLKDLLNKYLK